MKKKSFVFLVIVVGLLLEGCGKAETNSTQQTADDTSLVGKWEIDYEANNAGPNDAIANFNFVDSKKLVLSISGEDDNAIETKEGTYTIDNDVLKVMWNEGGYIESKLERIGEESISLDGMVLKNVNDFTYTSVPVASPSNSSLDIPQEYVFTAGNYTVGEDIPSGKYDVKWVSGSGNCVAGDMIEMFGEGEYRIKEYKNLTLTKTDTIKVSGTLEIKFMSK